MSKRFFADGLDFWVWNDEDMRMQIYDRKQHAYAYSSFASPEDLLKPPPEEYATLPIYELSEEEYRAWKSKTIYR